jgi:hypothetical protein
MSDDSEKPNVEKIIDSIKKGLEDNSPFDETQHKMDSHQKIKASLRKAAESAEVLGRCNGSLRGKLCKKLAWVAKPVVEQINLHNTAVIKSLNLMNKIQAEVFKEHINRLENEIQSLKNRSNS